MDVTAEEAREAIDRGDFHLVYQPIVELSTRRTVGFEALVRWTHPVHGELGPVLFIEQFERNGAIVDLGVWVTKRAMTEAARWHNAARATGRELYLSVNVSGYELQQANYGTALMSMCHDFEHRCQELRVEVIESEFDLSGAQVAANLHALRSGDVLVLIDDYGTGASDGNRTIEIHADGIKIDRGLIQAIETDPEQLARVIRIRAAAVDAGLEVIVEGIETPRQAEILAAHGFTHGQGYFFSRPVPAALVDSIVT